MKTITVSDEDYKTLMELSKELQTQANHHQAFPYFWEPSSKKREVNQHGEGSLVVFINEDSELCEPLEIWQDDEDLKNEFINDQDLDEETEFDEVEELWVEHLSFHSDKYNVQTMDWVDKQEHNPSLFLSDVQNFIKYNKHHLGKDPHTYSRSVWRMPKMQSLVECVLRLNKDHGEEVNHEAKRFIDKGLD